MAKVLVIDDTEEHLVVLKLMLQLKKHQVATALNKECALSSIATFKPDIILLDVLLHDGISGRDLSKFIKLIHPKIFVVLLSVDGKSLEHYGLCRADGIIEKPFEITTVFETINRLLA